MTRLGETIGGLWELLRIVLRSGFRLNSPYWQWRRETAFGSDPKRLSHIERLRQVIAYGRWVHRMKKGR